MHREMRAEMAQEYHRELDNMRQREMYTHPWELAAVDADGNELYRTEPQESREDAVAEAEVLNTELSNGELEDLDDEVDHFEPAERKA